MRNHRDTLLLAVAVQAYRAFADPHRIVHNESWAQCNSWAHCTQELDAAREKRRHFESQVGGYLARAEADAEQAVNISATLNKYPQKIREKEAAENALNERAEVLRAKLVRLKSTLSKDAAAKALRDREARDAVVESRDKASQAQRTVSLAKKQSATEAVELQHARAEGALAKRKAAEAASALEEVLHHSTTPPRQKPPLLYRPIRSYVEMLDEQSRQWILAIISLVIGVGGLLSTATYQWWGCWLLSVFGLPAVAALLVRATVAEHLDSSPHWQVLLNMVPLGTFLVLLPAVWRGLHGIHYFHGAWVGNSLACIILTLPYKDLWEALLVRFVFLIMGLWFAHNATERLRTKRVPEPEVIPHLCVASFTVLCGLLLSGSIVFTVDQLLPKVDQRQSFLSLVGVLLGADHHNEDVRWYSMMGASIWLTVVVLRMWFYVSKEAFYCKVKDEACDGAKEDNDSIAALSESSIEEQCQNLMCRDRAVEIAREDASRLIAGEVSEESTNLHEVVSLLTCTAAFFADVRHALNEEQRKQGGESDNSHFGYEELTGR
jgi:hypothetical protein